MTGALGEERRLLVELSRLAPRVSEGDIRVRGLDWDRIGAAAADHRVAPLVHRNLSRLLARELDGSARAVAERCRTLYIRNLARNACLYRELQRVLRRLRQAGVPVLVLKGAAMAPSLYGDIGLRYMDDLDLLVPEDARARALEILTDDGYRFHLSVPADLRARARRAGLARFQGPVDESTTAQIYTRFHFHYHLRRKGQFFPLEVHWHIAKPGTGVDIAELWRGAQATEIAGVETLCLRPEHLLLHLCLHLAGDPYGRLRLARLIDIEIAVTGAELDWGSVARAAARYGIARRVRVALGLTRRVLGIATPGEPAGTGGLGERALVHLVSRRWLADLGTHTPDQAPASRALLWRLAAEERWAGIARAFYRTAVHYPEDNRFLPERYRESEFLNLVYALHPSRWRSLRGEHRGVAVR
jgi:putative nucleotidyltransferase-like protein